MLHKLFNEHPESVGETYFEHQRMAMSFAGPLFMAGLACLIHAFVPCLCETTASRTVKTLYARLVTHRSAASHAVAPNDGVKALQA